MLDEMWEGELHLVPPPSEEHQRIGMELSVVLHSAVQGTGLVVRYETGLFDPHAPGASSYRVPDLVVFAAGQRSDRGVEGEAALVVEIQSPGDESFDKLDFYRRVGVAEVLMIDRDTKEVRHWHRAGDTLAEVDPESGTPAALSGLAVTFQAVDGTLVVSTPDGRTVI